MKCLNNDLSPTLDFRPYLKRLAVTSITVIAWSTWIALAIPAWADIPPLSPRESRAPSATPINKPSTPTRSPFGSKPVPLDPFSGIDLFKASAWGQEPYVGESETDPDCEAVDDD